MSSSSTLSISKWSALSLCAPELLSQLKMAVVFGAGGNEVLLVTRSNEVLGLGTNQGGCLGLGNTQSVLEPLPLKPLCGQTVATIAFGSGLHVVAVTEAGAVYTWGPNSFGELGFGDSGGPVAVPRRCLALEQHRVTHVACGGHHTLALTSTHAVYAWGQNNCGQVGCGSTSKEEAEPRQVSGELAERAVTGIACAMSSSFAVTTQGEVFSWGHNGSGQLGLGTKTNESDPQRVGTGDSLVQRLVCGSGHVLALTSESRLLSWGVNGFGQLGTGSLDASPTPVPVQLESSVRISDIGAVHSAHLSAAVCAKGRVLVWGKCRGQAVLTPWSTGLANLDEAFASLSSPAVTWRPLMLSSPDTSSVAESIRAHFDDEETSDVTFLVEDRELHAHRAILRIRSQYFRCMFQPNWTESEKRQIEVYEYSYRVYRAFLEYLYTDEVRLNPEDGFELLVLADAYCESHLKSECERLIRTSLASENVLSQYMQAIQFSAKSLEEFCFSFAVKNLTSVVQSEAFMSLDEKAVKAFILKAAHHGAFRH